MQEASRIVATLLDHLEQAYLEALQLQPNARLDTLLSVVFATWGFLGMGYRHDAFELGACERLEDWKSFAGKGHTKMLLSVNSKQEILVEVWIHRRSC